MSCKDILSYLIDIKEQGTIISIFVMLIAALLILNNMFGVIYETTKHTPPAKRRRQHNYEHDEVL